MMNVIYISSQRQSEIEARWKKLGIRSDHYVYKRMLEFIDSSITAPSVLVDAIVAICDPSSGSGALAPVDEFTAEDGAKLAARIRRLPPHFCMRDGRRWSSLPILVLTTDRDTGKAGYTRAGIERSAGTVEFKIRALTPDDSFCARTIVHEILSYRQRVISELDNLGFALTLQYGRYRIGPALKATEELSGDYYFGPGDLDITGVRYITVDRDALGAQREVEEFEALINRPDVAEGELQKFMEENPHFLSEVAEALPHVRLERDEDNVLIPDFILKPQSVPQRDSNWEVLDLKLPQMRLFTGPRARRQLSYDLNKALAQVRDYGKYFKEQSNADRIKNRLGHTLRYPKLGVLIGRLPALQFDELEEQQRFNPDVRIVTYDEILEQNKARIERVRQL